MLLHVACLIIFYANCVCCIIVPQFSYAFYYRGLFRLCSGLGIMNHSVKIFVLKKTFWHITAWYIP